jgi:molybdopterin-guanine dinucleotide biosynthesis protein A
VIARSDVTGVILCGGAGRRMGGREKALELAASVPLVSHVRARLAPQVGQIVISANRCLDRYAQWGDLVVADACPGMGPLGGLLTALERIDSPFTFCCPGDAPLLPVTLVARLATAAERGLADLAIPHDGVRRQPLFLLLRTSLRSSLREFLTGSGRAVQAWIDRQRTAVLDASVDRENFVNINTETDLVQLEHLLAPTGVGA